MVSKIFLGHISANLNLIHLSEPPINYSCQLIVKMITNMDIWSNLRKHPQIVNERFFSNKVDGHREFIGWTDDL
jgi:hypothetical protein